MNTEEIPLHPCDSIEVDEAAHLNLESNGFGVPASAPIMMDDDDESDASSKKTNLDADFGALPFFWKGRELAPFAIDREGDWNRHREALEDGPLKDLIRHPFALLPDALRVIWFCAHEPREWLSMPGMIQDSEGNWKRLTPKEKALNLEETIRAWSRENIDNSEQALVVSLFYDIYQRAQSTRATSRPNAQHDASREKK
jgi:hypothetical protein